MSLGAEYDGGDCVDDLNIWIWTVNVPSWTLIETSQKKRHEMLHTKWQPPPPAANIQQYSTSRHCWQYSTRFNNYQQANKIQQYSTSKALLTIFNNIQQGNNIQQARHCCQERKKTLVALTAVQALHNRQLNGFLDKNIHNITGPL